MTATKKKTKTAAKPKAEKASKPKLVKQTRFKEAKAPKAAKAPKEKKEAAPKVHENRIPVEEPKFNTNAHDGEKSGAFIRRMLETNALTNEEIAQLVQDNFAGSKATRSDVSFHRLRMKKEGLDVKLVRVDKDGNRYTLAD